MTTLRWSSNQSTFAVAACTALLGTSLLGCSSETGESQAGSGHASADLESAASTVASCTTDDGAVGTCITTSSCAALGNHVSTAGLCPGAADIQCCTAVGAGGSRYTTEKAWAEAHGVIVAAGVTTVVAKRIGADERTTEYQDVYDVFKADGTLATFTGSTRPAQPAPDDGSVPDVDGNGTPDLGILRPGIYTARGDIEFGLTDYERPAFHVLYEGRDGLPAWRDLDGDGVFSAGEKSLSVSRGYLITEVLIHYGFDPDGTTFGDGWGTQYGAWSVGCQNIPYSYLDSFISAVGGAGETFTYAVIEDQP